MSLLEWPMQVNASLLHHKATLHHLFSTQMSCCHSWSPGHGWRRTGGEFEKSAASYKEPGVVCLAIIDLVE